MENSVYLLVLELCFPICLYQTIKMIKNILNMNLLNTFKSIAFGILITVFCGCNAKEKNTEKKPLFVQNIDSLMIKSYERELFNGNVLVVKNDTIVYQKSFGFTDGTQQKKLDSNSIFNIGSISKQFNGIAIMILQERGLLSVHDTISKFDLGLPDWSKKITISNLLNYTSGTPRLDVVFPSNDDEAWEMIRSVDTLLFEPGTRFLYDNSNVFLQKRIIEKVTGQSFQKFVRENIINPLNMTNTVFDPTADYPNRTSCYDFNKVQCPEMEFISGWPWLSINDLYTWVDALNSNKLISKESFNVLLINPYVKDRASSLGEYFEKEQLHRHNGTAIKFRSVMLNDFKNELTIILLSNNPSPAVELGHMIHNAVLGKEFEIPKKSIRQVLKKTFIEDVDKGIATYYDLKQKHPEVYDFDLPVELNRLGYDLYGLQKSINEVIKFFKFAVLQFPYSANLHDSLAEMYFNNKQYDFALKNYKKSIALGGTAGNAKMMVEKINKLLKND